MYCNKCGKEILAGTLCDECAADAVAPIYIQDGRKLGFGKALTSTIMGNIGLVFVYIALFLGFVVPVAGWGLAILITPLVIVPLVLGIKSIKIFVTNKHLSPKPVATLVLGIVGLSSAALSAFLHFIILVVFIV
ncbi:MAG: hypothetical protein IKV16_05465 [Clostridia bacterium]|nr:hypothetical protein [Clostridia bacterium]